MWQGRARLPWLAALFVGLTGFAPRGSPAQQGAEQLPSLGVEVVRVDVVVTDKGGHPRSGLGRDDFAVLEDGVPQKIVQFQAVSRWPSPTAARSAPAAEDQPMAATPRRYVVLAIDDVHLGFASLVRVQKALRHVVEEDLSDEDEIAFVTTSGARALSQDFTAERPEILEALARLSAQDRRSEWGGVPHISEYQAELIEGGDPVALDAAVQEILHEGIFQDAATAEAQARRKALGTFTEAVYNSRLTLETLEGLIRELSGLAGRKVIFLVSDGFLTGLSARSGAGFDIRRITDAATRAGVVLYALDTRGLSAPTPGASASGRTRVLPTTFGVIDSVERRGEAAMLDAMNALATDTGGFMVHDANDLRVGMRRMLKDTETYYVLAYEPTSTKRDGRFRQIEVRLPGQHGVKLRARKGYFAPDDSRGPAAGGKPADEALRAERRLWAMRTAFNSLAPLTGIPVHVSADFVANGQLSEIVVSGHVDSTTLPFARGQDRYQATVETAAVVYDETGAAAATLDTQRTTMDLTAAAHEQVLKEGISYQKAVALKPGRYQVRLVAREDSGGAVGSAWQWVQVPDLEPGQLTLSSLFLLRAGEPAAEPAADAQSQPALQSAQALRRFRRDESLYLQIYAYNARRDAAGATNLVSQAEVLRGGVPLGSAAPEPMVPSGPRTPAVPHTSGIKLRSFEAGDYELRVTVSDRNANAVASRRIGFTVE